MSPGTDHRRINPAAVYQPRPGAYSMVVAAGGSAQWSIAGIAGAAGGSYGSMGSQVEECARALDSALGSCGLAPGDVVRMTVFTTDVERYQAEGRNGLFAYFGDTRPATVLAGVTALRDSGRALELELLAVSSSVEPRLGDDEAFKSEEKQMITTRRALPNGAQVVRSEGSTQLHLAGIVALDLNRQLVGEDDLEIQTDQTLENVRNALQTLESDPRDVARLRVYLTDIDRYAVVVEPRLRTFFAGAMPAVSVIGVTRLAEPRLLIELEATAIPHRYARPAPDTTTS